MRLCMRSCGSLPSYASTAEPHEIHDQEKHLSFDLLQTSLPIDNVKFQRSIPRKLCDTAFDAVSTVVSHKAGFP